MLSDRIKRYINLKNLIFFLSIVMFVWLAWYFYTGFGGPTELVAHLVPVALMLQILHMHQNGYHLQAAVADCESYPCGYLHGHLSLCLLSLSYGIRADLHLPAGLLYQGGLHHGFAGFPPGDGAVADRPIRSCSG